MSPEHARYLYERYSAIFAQRRLPMTQSSMWMGFSCGDGWFAIVDDLCVTLQAGVDRGDFPQPSAVQVKEKHAELRIYLNRNAHETAQQLPRDVRARSLKVCETCGAPGVLRERDHWYCTRCDLHAEPGSVVVPDKP